MRPRWSTMTMASGADSSSARNLSSEPLRAVTSRMALMTMGPCGVSYRAEADLDRELAAVLAQAVKLKAHAHGAHVRIAGEIAGAMAGMFGAEAWWNKDLDFLSGEFERGIAEELLALGVGEHNTALLIDHKHRVAERRPRRPRSSPQQEFPLSFPRLRDSIPQAARFRQTGPALRPRRGARDRLFDIASWGDR